MDRELRRHRSTANTAKLISSIVLISAFLLLVSAIVMFAISVAPFASPNSTDWLSGMVEPWLDINIIQSAKLMGLFVLFSWMGYVLRVLVCLLESQIPDIPKRSANKNAQ